MLLAKYDYDTDIAVQREEAGTLVHLQHSRFRVGTISHLASIMTVCASL